MSEFEVVLPRRVVAQPKPNVYPLGDCGPCVLSGLLGLLGPAEVYAKHCEGKPASLSRFDIQRILRVEGCGGALDRYIEDAPIGWPVHEEWRAFGSTSNQQWADWFRYVAMAIDAGYYGIAQIAYSANGRAGEVRHLYQTDHWVMICGARAQWRPHPTLSTSRTLESEIFVSCSAAHPEGRWYEARDFLTERGGFNLLFGRPRA